MNTNIYLELVLTSILLFVPTIANPYKMVVIYGQPKDYSYITLNSMSFSTCIDYCYKSNLCAAFYTTEGTDVCITFNFGQISSLTQLNSSYGKVMGVKMLSDNSTDCPISANGNSMKTGYQINSTIFQPYSITSSNNVWVFTAGSLNSCPTKFTLFVRPMGPWCIAVIPVSTCVAQNDSVAACKNTYGGVLSGLQTIDERDFVIKTGTPWIGLQSTYPTFGFWVNGNRKESCKETNKSASCDGTNEFEFTDPYLTAYDGYVWADNQPSGLGDVPSTSDCLNLFFRSDIVYGIDDYRCFTKSVNQICYKGYVCGKLPN